MWRKLLAVVPILVLKLFLPGCRTPAQWRSSADKAAHDSLVRAQYEAVGYAEPLRVETPADTFRRRLIETQQLPVVAALSADPAQLPDLAHWEADLRRLTDEAPPPAADSVAVMTEPVLSLNDALQLAAHGNRDYQSRKESLFLTALELDLEKDKFRNTLAGMLGGSAEVTQGEDATVSATGVDSSLSAARMLRTGARITAALTVDLVNLLTQDRASAFGLRFDSSISVPLGRGAGRHIVMESLTQAQRDLLTAVWEFEHYKTDFAVEVATRYFNVLASEDQVRNAEDNFRRLQTNAQRARFMSEAGRLPEIQVDQAVQEALRASSRSVAAVRRHADALDQFKVFLGVPPDARLQLDRGELDNLARVIGERFAPANGEDRLNDIEGSVTEMPNEILADEVGEPVFTEQEAMDLALENRLDLRAVLSRVEDAQRKVIVAADALGTEVTLSGDASFGEGRSPSAAGRGDARFRVDEGRYSSLLRADFPWRRTAERNTLRRSLVNLEQNIRRLQEYEDRVKLEVRGDLRALGQALENLVIQTEAMRIARRQVRGSDLFLDAGRAAIRDVLEAQDALLSAQNAYTDAVVAYRLTKLGFQRNLGLLHVGADGLWTEWQE